MEVRVSGKKIGLKRSENGERKYNQCTDDSRCHGTVSHYIATADHCSLDTRCRHRVE